MGGRYSAAGILKAATLILFGAFALVVADPLFAHGPDRAGSFGLFSLDQTQYLAWARDAGSHGLISNLFDIRPAPHVLLHPLFLITGLVHRVTGLALPIAE